MDTLEKHITKTCKQHGETIYTYVPSRKHYRCSQCLGVAVTKRRRKLKELAVAYLGGACAVCGYNKCVAALEFHHRDPVAKDFSISSTGTTRSFDKIKVELDKCLLLCANCHREHHAGVE